MIYCVFFEDDEQFSGARAIHMRAHLEFLKKNQHIIREAGPLFDIFEKKSAGLWVAEADSVDDVIRCIEMDPFWPTGLRKSYRLMEWHQVFSCMGKKSDQQAENSIVSASPIKTL